jgi:hypothetical protein
MSRFAAFRRTPLLNPFLWWGARGASLMVLGALGPWIRMRAFGGGIVERRCGGVLVLAAATVRAALLIAWRERPAAGIAALLTALASLVVTLHDRRQIASLSLALCGLVWLVALADPPRTAAELEPTPPLSWEKSHGEGRKRAAPRAGEPSSDRRYQNIQSESSSGTETQPAPTKVTAAPQSRKEMSRCSEWLSPAGGRSSTSSARELR